ncbi:MAG: hypothetical protein IPN72_03305 [Saprospiraceae bacterium]|nr:hypothetical protein [Saprospiraceae bacterium]
MGYPTKIQLIKRANSEQWYVNFPAAVAQAIEFQKGKWWNGLLMTIKDWFCKEVIWP